jgi:hypothetical protein
MSIAVRIVGVAVIALGLTGCASVINGRDQKVSFTSEPTGARVVVTDLRKNLDVQSGTTPFQATLKRGAGWFKEARYKVTVEQAGFKKEEVTLEGRRSGWYIGNLLIGDLFGYLVVDPLTGGMWVLEPGDVKVVLKKDAAALPAEEGVRVVLLRDVPTFLLTKLKPIERP